MTLPNGMTQEELDIRNAVFRQKQDDQIDRLGWTVVVVTGSVSTPPFSYTVGLAKIGLPEILVTGLSDSPMGPLIIIIAEQVFKNKEAFNEGVYSGPLKLKDGNGLRIALRKVSDLTHVQENYILGAVSRYGTGVQCMQLIWGDDKNVLPTEPGYNPSMQQPLL